MTQSRAQDGVDRGPMNAPSLTRGEDPNRNEASPFPFASGNAAPLEGSRSGAGHFIDLLEDQKEIWTSPSRVRVSDATWLAPLGGIAAGLFVTDREYSASLSQNPSTQRHYKEFSNVGLASLAGAGAGLYLFSYPAHNPHWRETGLLAGEAALNSLISVEALKYSLPRERPFQGDGSFFHGGSSFPSEHAAVAWSVAGVIAHEYSGTLPRLLAYGMASAVSFSRVRSGQHFPSDALIGSTLGYLIAQNVYRRRHDPEMGGSAWQSPHELVIEPTTRTPSFMGSPYVPLDSWVYPAIERLAALGYVKTDSLGMRPWTRLECTRLVSEAADFSADVDGPAQLQELFHALSEEFAAESVLMSGEQNAHAQIESVYQRSMAISGKPLTDGYHFGQTVLDNFGRPFQQGFNNVSGTSAWAVAGPFVIYARGEYQYSPSGPAPSQGVLDFISSADSLPPNAPSFPTAATTRFRLLDAYIGMNLANWQISYGKQSLWWGPSAGGTMAFTDNTAPLNMFRINRVSPFRLPGVFSYLGDLRLDFFLGQLTGQEFLNNGLLGKQAQGAYGENLNPQPFLSGARISFKFTPNFEFNMSKTTIYGGPGNPLTPTTLLKSALDMHQNGEPLGDGRSAIDFSYRIPRLRNWLTLYGEGFTEDEISPLAKPGKSVWQGGLYFAQIPKLNRLDMRVEGGFTSPVDFSTCNGCFYHNFQYVNGFTNAGQLMGTWIGRSAQGESVTSNYWFGANKKISVELRHRKIDSQFLPQGGTQNDAAFTADLMTRSGFRFSGTVQYEQWQVPLLAADRQSNVMASFQFSYWPKVHGK
ncbi:MAG: capsule assembly Wzi family protein [Candidatus Sulfotelmatobacter sp.]